MSMVDLAFAPDVEAPAAARAELANLGLDRAEGQAVMLLASELVTNCIRHAGVGRRQRIRLRALVTDTLVRIEVIDSGAGMRVVMRLGDDHGGWACAWSTASPTAGASFATPGPTCGSR